MYFGPYMVKIVNKTLINAWIKKQGRDGITKLAIASDIPSGSLSKIRAGRVPVKPTSREKLARVLGVKEDVLFPVKKTSTAS